MKYGFICGTAHNRVAPVLVSMAIVVSWGVASPASAQEETGAESVEAPTPETGAESPEAPTSETGAESVEAPTSETGAEVPETATEEQWPSAVEPEEQEKKSPYHNKVQGKLRVEVLFGPSRFDPDALSAGSSGANAPRVSGPEFGVTLLGGPSTSTHFVGATYRQANYDVYKLMKAGLANQWAWRTPYVHPMLRLDVCYAHIFDGAIYPSVDGSPRHGLSTTFGFGVRVPIVRWVSFAATFDWSLVSLFATKGDVINVLGSQIVGTFSLMGHFIGVDENR